MNYVADADPVVHPIVEWDQVPVFFVDDFIYRFRIIKDIVLVASFDYLKLVLSWFFKHQF